MRREKAKELFALLKKMPIEARVSVLTYITFEVMMDNGFDVNISDETYDFIINSIDRKSKSDKKFVESMIELNKLNEDLLSISKRIDEKDK